MAIHDVSCLMDKLLRKTNKEAVLPAAFSQGVILTLRDAEGRQPVTEPFASQTVWKVQVVAVFCSCFV